MIDDEIAFYKGNAVHDILRRFKFGDDEKSIINVAIRTSKSKTPSMKIIQKAGLLLKDIAKTSVSLEAMSIKQKRRSFTK